MRLSRSFTDNEFRCRCCGRVNISRWLIIPLQALRDSIASPIIITCGYRCPKHNQEVGGVKASYHIGGKAADCAFPFMSLFDALDAALAIPAFKDGGVGIYLPYWECKSCGHKWEQKERPKECPECECENFRKRDNFLHLDVRLGMARWGRRLGKKCSFQEAFNQLQKGKV
jgi:hypothetical protein